MTPTVGNPEGRSASAALSLLLRITLAALLAASIALLACGGETPRPTAPGVTAPAAIPPTLIPSNTPAPTATPAATPTPTALPPTPTATPAPTPIAVGEPSAWDELHFSRNPADYADRHLWGIFQAVRDENVSLFFGDGTGGEWTPGEIEQVNRLLVAECRNTAEEMQAVRQVFLDAYGSAAGYHEQRSVEFQGVEWIANDAVWVSSQVHSAEYPELSLPGVSLLVFADGRWRSAACEQGRAAYAPGPPPLPTVALGETFWLYDSDLETPYQLTLLGPPERDGDLLIIPARIGALNNLFDPYYRSFVGELVMEPAAGGPAQRLFDYPVDTDCPGSIFAQTDVLLVEGGSWEGNLCFRPELPAGTTLADWRFTALEYWIGDEPYGRVDFTAVKPPPERAAIQSEAFLAALTSRLGATSPPVADCYGRDEYELTVLQGPEIIGTGTDAETARLKVRLTATADEPVELDGLGLSLITAPAIFGQVTEIIAQQTPHSPENPEREVYFQPVNPAEFDGETLPPGQSHEAYIHFGNFDGAPLPEAPLAILAYYYYCDPYFIDLTSRN